MKRTRRWMLWLVVILLAVSSMASAQPDLTVIAWGSNYNGQLEVPPPNSGFIYASAGHRHSLGLKSDGSVVGWGDNFYGQCDVPAPNAGYVSVVAAGGN